jgi:two-component system, response regulator PdtaR
MNVLHCRGNKAVPHTSEPTKALRVLVVEDDMMIGVLLAGTLEDMGYDVCAVEATEAGAVTAAAQYRPELMIVDARLGNGSGISAVEEILRTGFIPHLFMTGNVSRVKALRPGAVVLQKPFREAELTRAIQRALDRVSAS